MTYSQNLYGIPWFGGVFGKGFGMDILLVFVLVMTLSGTAVFDFDMWRFRRQFG